LFVVCLCRPQKLQMNIATPSNGLSLWRDSTLSPRAILLNFFMTLLFLGRGMGREMICLIQCSTYPNITYITGLYGCMCLGFKIVFIELKWRWKIQLKLQMSIKPLTTILQIVQSYLDPRTMKSNGLIAMEIKYWYHRLS